MERTVAEQKDGTAARVTALLEEVIGGSPVFVVEVDVRGTHGSRVVDIYVDSDAELDVDELARINRELGFLLDTEEIIQGSYNLNVSSPGLDRPLAVPRQYRKNVGRVLRIHYAKDDGSGNTEVDGEVLAADDHAVEVAASESDVRRIPFDNIIWAKVQLPW
ncbi:MAG: ribosome maturation factor RimP [Rhodothermales bacterium]